MPIVFGLGRIGEIILYLKKTYNVSSIAKIKARDKLDTLCRVLQLNHAQLDRLIVENSQVMRTIKGHAFETAFEHLLTQRGYEVTTIGGDKAIDLRVNQRTLQLKTPYEGGTKEGIVSYKTHKTHGAKSEQESIEYYHSADEFAEFLVGLVSYKPLRILFLSKEDLPRHSQDPNRIISPFKIDWTTHPALNAFHRIGVENIGETSTDLTPNASFELLPRTAKELNLTTDIILNTILSEPNFRIWDMAIRGFSRELYFRDWLRENSVQFFDPADCRGERALKADLALLHVATDTFRFFQVKGLSVNHCQFSKDKSRVGVETQLTRGRVNDHPTQSRLYLFSDFEFLIIGLDPSIAQMYNAELGIETELRWEFYAIPVEDLKPHSSYTRRIKSVQTFSYKELQQYRIDKRWFDSWQ